MAERYRLPAEFNFITRRLLTFVVYGSAWLLALERLGVSGAVLWSAFTGFAAVAAVAFFAAWSVLSNIFCSLLIFTTGIFRLNDRIEVLENGEKAGLKGRVIDINLIYTTLEESGNGREGTVLKVPNSYFSAPCANGAPARSKWLCLRGLITKHRPKSRRKSQQK